MMKKSTKERYIYSAWEIGEYLGLHNEKYRIYNKDSIMGKAGIISFYNYHVDLVYTDVGWIWDSLELVGNHGSSIDNYMNNRKTYFMELGK
jgi:hypothetical protein